MMASTGSMCAVVLLLLAVAAPAVHGWWSPRTKKTSLATFNAALVPFYPELEARATLLAEELKKSKVDIWCLEEVWYADVQRALYDEVKENYKYALSAINLTDYSDDGSAACNSAATAAVEACINQSNCEQTYNSSREISVCVILSCASVISALPDACRDCVTVKLVAGVQSVLTCATTEKASRYETTYGLMILSKEELLDTKYGGITEQSQFRGYLKATVEDVGVLMCVHLSNSVTSSLYVGPPLTSPFLYSSYAEQQYQELSVITNLMKGAEEPIFLGDFNHSPLVPGGDISSVLPLHYGVMAASSLVSPYVDACGLCTWCGGGVNYVAAATIPGDFILDHIYISAGSCDRVTKTERLFAGKTVPSSTSPSVDIPLSDHYGVMVELKDYQLNCSWSWSRLLYGYFCKETSTKFEPLSSLNVSRQELCGSMQ